MRRITTWVRHCVCDPSLPPYEGLMRIGHGKFDDDKSGDNDDKVGDGIVNEFGVEIWGRRDSSDGFVNV